MTGNKNSPTDDSPAARPLADSYGTAAYGGDGWSPRLGSHRQEIGDLWTDCGINSEWKPLEAVLVHRPGTEVQIPEDKVNAVQFAEKLDLSKAQAEHDYMVEIYRENNVDVQRLEVGQGVTANQLYCADLFVMTDQGAILGRPASTVRAGEERRVAETLAGLGIPVIKILTGTATFEGADLMWLDPQTAAIGKGLRTNQEGIAQITTVLAELGVNTKSFDMPYGTMHFMGMLRIVDKDLAFIWPRRTPYGVVNELKQRGFEVLPLPDLDEAMMNMAFNFVVLGPRKIMLPAKNPNTRAVYEKAGIECISIPVDELRKANGAMGCMTGILKRQI